MSKSGRHSVAHVVFVKVDSSRVDGPSTLLLALLLYLGLPLSAFFILHAFPLFKLNDQKWSLYIFSQFPGIMSI